MNFLPDTTRTKPGRHPVILVLAVVCLGLLLLAVVISAARSDFSPGEELVSPGAEDIAVSQEDTTYPSSDRLRFEDGPEVVYVYLSVEDLTTDGDFEARVGRTSRISALGLLLGHDELRVVDEGEERLSVSGSGVSGVVKFAVRDGRGRRLPPGNYKVEVYTAAGGARERSVVARKYFVVGD